MADTKCPNCGANYTNSKKCEYCGSMLPSHLEDINESEKNLDGTKSITPSNNLDEFLGLGIGIDILNGIFNSHKSDDD